MTYSYSPIISSWYLLCRGREDRKAHSHFSLDRSNPMTPPNWKMEYNLLQAQQWKETQILMCTSNISHTILMVPIICYLSKVKGDNARSKIKLRILNNARFQKKKKKEKQHNYIEHIKQWSLKSGSCRIVFLSPNLYQTVCISKLINKLWRDAWRNEFLWLWILPLVSDHRIYAHFMKIHIRIAY